MKYNIINKVVINTTNTNNGRLLKLDEIRFKNGLPFLQASFRVASVILY